METDEANKIWEIFFVWNFPSVFPFSQNFKFFSGGTTNERKTASGVTFDRFSQRCAVDVQGSCLEVQSPVVFEPILCMKRVAFRSYVFCAISLVIKWQTANQCGDWSMLTLTHKQNITLSFAAAKDTWSVTTGLWIGASCSVLVGACRAELATEQRLHLGILSRPFAFADTRNLHFITWAKAAHWCVCSFFRTEVYKTVHTWLQYLGASSGIEMCASDLRYHLLADIAPQIDNLKVSCTQVGRNQHEITVSQIDLHQLLCWVILRQKASYCPVFELRLRVWYLRSLLTCAVFLGWEAEKQASRRLHKQEQQTKEKVCCCILGSHFVSQKIRLVCKQWRLFLGK